MCALPLFLSISYPPIDFSFPRSDSCYFFHIYFIIDAVTFCWLRNTLFKMQVKSRIQIFHIPSVWIALTYMVGKRILLF